MVRSAQWLSVLAWFTVAPSLVRAQSFELLGFMPGGGAPSHAYEVSSDGAVVVGLAKDPMYGALNPYRWTQQGGIVGLGPKVAINTYKGSIKLSGDGRTIFFAPENTLYTWSGSQVIAGWYPENLSYDGSVLVGARTDDQLRGQATLWSQSTGFVDLGFLLDATWSTSVATDVSADGRVVIGYSTADSGTTGFRWSADGGMIDLGTFASAISADGSVIAGGGLGGPIVRWTETGGVQPLGVNGFVSGISGDGRRIVGNASVPIGDGYENLPFIWDAHSGVRNLVDVFTSEYGFGGSFAEWTPTSVSGISDDGKTLIGSALRKGVANPQFQAWRATIPPLPAVPEPAAITQVLIFTASRYLVRRRCRKLHTIPDDLAACQK